MASRPQQAHPPKVTERSTASSVEVDAPTRREFLYYIWAASMLLLVGEATAGLIWFVMPRFKEGTFGSTFKILPDQLPSPGGSPNIETTGCFWIARPEEGLIMLYVVCTHLGCLYKWVDTNNRFECPCHGSKFELNGKYITGPAPRSLDRFHTTIIFTDGTTSVINNDGDPLSLDGREIAEIVVYTGNKVMPNGRI